ncbi:hypothetical protein GS887_27735 [Rhodococcus hoagii]|nr:hypothetical protein [Prescottella equi]
MNADENGSAASFFDTLVNEAVGPFFVSLDEDVEVIIEAPSGDDVAEFDTTVSVHDQLDLLVDEDTADVILDFYARRPISELADLVDDIREHFGILVPPDQGWAALVHELNRYGEAIEKDLFTISAPKDLYDWIRDHANLPWNKLFRILPTLPRGGWYETAILDDDERADQILAMETDGNLPAPSKRPSLLGWTPEIGSCPRWSTVSAVLSTACGVPPRNSRARAGSRRSLCLARRPPANGLRNGRRSASTTTSPPNSSASATRAATRTPGGDAWPTCSRGRHSSTSCRR